MVLVWLFSLVGFATITLLAIAGVLWVLDILAHGPEARARRIQRDAAVTEAQIRAIAWAARRAMHEEARRRLWG